MLFDCFRKSVVGTFLLDSAKQRWSCLAGNAASRSGRRARTIGRAMSAIMVLAAIAACLNAQEIRWMIARDAIQHIDEAGGKGAAFFAAPGNIVINGTSGAEGFPEGYRAMPAATFCSYAELKSALDSGQLLKEVKAVIYDSESWRFTPTEEQHNVAKFYKLAADEVHRHGLLFVATPATDLTRVLGPRPPSAGDGVKAGHVDEFLRLGIARDAARYADIYEIQAQRSVDNLSLYTRYVKEAAAQARAANPKVIIFAGLTTAYPRDVTAQQLYDAVMATRSYVVGYWLNVPSGGPGCPTCGKAKPQVAVELLKMLAVHSSN
jgi:hypothetical protein